jgi:hypothetical protein
LGNQRERDSQKTLAYKGNNIKMVPLETGRGLDMDWIDPAPERKKLSILMKAEMDIRVS